MDHSLKHHLVFWAGRHTAPRSAHVADSRPQPSSSTSQTGSSAAPLAGLPTLHISAPTTLRPLRGTALMTSSTLSSVDLVVLPPTARKRRVAATWLGASDVEGPWRSRRARACVQRCFASLQERGYACAMKPPYSPRRSGCTRSNRTQSPLSPARARASRPSAGVRSGRRRSRDIPVAEAECLAMRSAGSTSAARPSSRDFSKRMPHRSQAQRAAGRPSAQWKCAQHFDIEDPIQKPAAVHIGDPC